MGGDGLHQFTGFQLRNVAQPWGGWRSPDSLTAGCRHLQWPSTRWDAAAIPFPGFNSQFIAPSKRVPRAGGRAGDGRCDQLLDRPTQTRFWTPSSSAVYTLTAAWDRDLSTSFEKWIFSPRNQPNRNACAEICVTVFMTTLE